jgi:hypothetical protein
MKKYIYLYMLITLWLPSCNAVSIPTPTNTPMPSNTSSPTYTSTPTITPTKTPQPTATLRPELTAEDVGLPWDTTQTNPILTPCYLWSDNYFHAGDGIIFSYYPDKTYFVLAPISGEIIEASNMTNFRPVGIGWEITIATEFSKKGKQVYVDFVHTSGLVPGLRVGQHVERSQPLLILDKHWGGHSGELDLFLDIGIRNGPKGANPQVDNWQPESYFSFLEFIYDDLEQLPPNTYSLLPTCAGNPISPENRLRFPAPTKTP